MFDSRKKSSPDGKNAVSVECEDATGTLKVCPFGAWSIAQGLRGTQDLETAVSALSATESPRLTFDCSGLSAYDSALICFLLKCIYLCREKKIPADLNSLPEDIRRLTELALFATPEQPAPTAKPDSADIFYRIGNGVTRITRDAKSYLGFLGETVCAFFRLFRGKARYRKRDILYFIQNCGFEALPIIALISFITGMILAYIGAMQLGQFGAIIYVVSLIAIAMYREMGVIMTSVIMCGRTGSAFAAQIGSMQASEEISALRVLGINPVEYLVLPRMIALTLMMPILTFYSNAFGLAGGFAVVSTMGVTFEQFWHQTVLTMNLEHLFSGLIKSVFFGWLVAWAGCYRGMTAGKSSLDVGAAATSAAVLGITLIVIGDGIFAVVFNILGF
ncbi:MAG: ABC transporter permease [Verrucomicrobia bacterium]|nr:ABC transporter permease [Verrucomicrobiota bacterium]